MNKIIGKLKNLSEDNTLKLGLNEKEKEKFFGFSLKDKHIKEKNRL